MIVAPVPQAWQETGGQRVQIMMQYVVDADGTVGFEAAAYDKARPLAVESGLLYVSDPQVAGASAGGRQSSQPSTTGPNIQGWDPSAASAIGPHPPRNVPDT